ncbi:putative NADP-dependent mannitol dehydrogenase [Byssothecium circinans]|uniref:NADP-dependent mannitol dehydrogenase n=1 Tax=Byssothecium circinans TaxID=147558 RepID=A0A6A5U027_9PLEO|nr:putative NADP-dependent mannitol dehydrogenase [Byssothecium circinans]
MSMSLSDCQTPRPPNQPPSIPSNVLEQFSLRDRVCVITGASGGIGSAIAEGYAEAGAHLALWYNSNPSAITLASSLSKTHNITAKAFQVNVSDPLAVKNGVEQVVKEFGKLDVFVANAGKPNSKPLLEMPLEEIRDLHAVNMDSVVYCAKYAGEVFKRQGRGNLIITASISAHIVNVPVDQPIYNATKAYILHLGKSLAREWREFARVNIVSPGFFNTAMGASDKVENEAHRMAVLGRQGETKEIKGVYLYLASDASSYQTGSDTLIDGGYTLP